MCCLCPEAFACLLHITVATVAPSDALGKQCALDLSSPTQSTTDLPDQLNQLTQVTRRAQIHPPLAHLWVTVRAAF